MRPRITLITLGVDDLQRAVRFYRDGLGFKTEGIVGTEFEHGAVAFFDLQPGLKLALWPRTSIAHDTGIALGSPNPTEFTLGHNVASKGDVEAVIAQAKKAGAVVVKPAHDTFWGGTRATSKIRTDICGRWHGIPSGLLKSEAKPVSVSHGPRERERNAEVH
jgi:catechol 2,3-dioxygenase-like lactoylglutathione lyase family enzyme